MSFAKTLGNYQLGENFSGGFFTRVPERALSSGVELDHDSITVHRDDRVERRPEHCGFSFLAFLDCALSRDPLRDVRKRDDRAEMLPILNDRRG